MTIQICEKLKCKDCGAEFRWVPRNSTIKPKSCLRCHNKRLLERSILSRNNKPTYVMGKHVSKKVGGLKRRKSDKSKAMKTADKWFSLFVRIKDSKNGVVSCYTCGNYHSIKIIECGHWQRRGYKVTRYHENNARPQCTRCNHFRSGEPEKFELLLKSEIGDDQVDELKSLAQGDFGDTVEFYREQADKYRKLVNELVKEKQIKKWW